MHERIAHAIAQAQKHNPWRTTDAAAAATLLRKTIATNVACVLGEEDEHFDAAAFLRNCGVLE